MNESKDQATSTSSSDLGFSIGDSVIYTDGKKNYKATVARREVLALVPDDKGWSVEVPYNEVTVSPTTFSHKKDDAYTYT